LGDATWCSSAALCLTADDRNAAGPDFGHPRWGQVLQGIDTSSAEALRNAYLARAHRSREDSRHIRQIGHPVLPNIPAYQKR
jgi:hypothetical protein